MKLLAALKRAKEFNEVILQKYIGEIPPTYSMKQVLLRGETLEEDKKQVIAFLYRFKHHQAIPEALADTPSPGQFSKTGSGGIAGNESKG